MMATIPTYAEWTSKTNLGMLKPRSQELKNVDVALRTFEQDRNGTALKALALAWNAWKRTKPDWKASERNKGRILEQLNDAIAERMGPVMMTPQEKEAIRYMDEQRRRAVQTMFRGRKVRLKALNAKAEAKKQLAELTAAGKSLGSALGAGSSVGSAIGSRVPSSVKGLGGGAGGAMSSARSAVESMLTKFFDVASIQVLGPFLLETFGTDLVAAMTPVVGHLKSASSVIIAWGDVGKKKYDEYANRKHRAFIGGPGTDAAQAFGALDRLLTSELHNAAVGATMKTTSFTARSLLVLADGGTVSGPAVGAAEALANLTFRIYQIAGEYKETRRANKLLARPEVLDFKLFDAYPLLGCYMLAGATLSDIMNMSMIEFGGYGWMDDVEHIKKTHIDPVRKKSFDLIRASLFELEGVSPLVNATKLDKAKDLAKVARTAAKFV
jgi:hypothetical protein